ncbi:MAG: S8 family serine peptidase [Nitrospinota bacterium]
MRKRIRLFVQTILVGLAFAVLLLALGASPAGAQELVGPAPLPEPPGEPEVIPGQYIVELKRGVGRDAFINAHRLAAFRRFTLINGFAARMSQRAANRLAADARVRSVSPDLVVHAFPKAAGGKYCEPWPSCKNGSTDPPPEEGGGGCPDLSGDPDFNPASNPEEAPPGVRRIGADSATATGAGVKVAVIDTGIDPCHPDLVANYKGGKNFVDKGNKPPKDGHGHGTHVAGTIAAVNNPFGVVGVARDAHLYAVKVLDKDGSGSLSTVIKGLDWAWKNGMQVANLSLGAFDFSLGSGPMCNAVANAVAAGVTVVAAAGNSGMDAIYSTPANCAHSLTVSAFADSNGSPGGGGPGLDWNGDGVVDEDDDTWAWTFSNYSAYCWDFDGDGLCETAYPPDSDSLVVNMMASGVVTLSTMPTYDVTLTTDYGKSKNYDTLTGTSMAAPHTAGAAALYLQANPGDTPEQVRVALTTGGACWDGTGNPDKGTDISLPIICDPPWPDDDLSIFGIPLTGYPEPLLNVRGL